MMEGALEPFRRAFDGVVLRPPQIPFVSNVTGTWITEAEATDPAYWVGHLRQPVRFAEGVGRLLEDARQLLLEVGPGRVLSTLARQHPGHAPSRLTLTTLRHPGDDTPDEAFLLTTLGRLWLSGVSVDWAGVYRHESRRRVPLPTYPFQRQRHWLERTGPVGAAIGGGGALDVEGAKGPVETWLYLPTWRRTVPPGLPGGVLPAAEAEVSSGEGPWFLVADEDPPVAAVAAALAGKVEASGRQLLRGTSGEALPAGTSPSRVVVLLPEVAGEESGERLAPLLTVLQLLQKVAATATATAAPVEVTVAGSGLLDPLGDGAIAPERAAVVGACRVAPQEVPGLTCRVLDLGDGEDAETLASEILAEITAGSAERTVAYRGARRRNRWLPEFERIPSPPAAPQLRPGARLLVVGGFGDIGGTLAREVAALAAGGVAPRLALLGRSPVPPSGLASGPRAALVAELEGAGAEVLPLSADVADGAAMTTAVDQVIERFGGLDGVIYAAGFGGLEAARTLAETSREDFEAQFRARTGGLDVLAEVLEAAGVAGHLDFCLVSSSLSSILGGLGYTAYAAANRAMDAWVQRHNATASDSGGTPWTAVQWDGWRFTKDEAPGTEFSMTPEEGREVFRRLLALDPPLPQWGEVVVSTAPLAPRVERWVARAGGGAEAGRKGSGEVHRRPDLQNAYVAPVDPIETQIAEVWQEQLGIDRVGRNDNFFELGGTSLLGVQVIAGLNRAFGVEIPTVSLYEGSTVKALAEVLRGLQGETTQQEARLEQSHDRGEKRREQIRRRREARRGARGRR
jgi:acyl transferase domain-containing protein